MPDRWEAGAARIVESWVDASQHELCVDVATLARCAFRAGLEHARGIALDVAGEYPEDIFRPIEPGELPEIDSLDDGRIGAHIARITARNIAAAIRREIEGVDKQPESQANSPTP